MGRELLRQLKIRQIDKSGIIIEKERPTTLKTRIVAHGQQVVRFDRESRRAIAKRAQRKYFVM